MEFKMIGGGMIKNMKSSAQYIVFYKWETIYNDYFFGTKTDLLPKKY